MEDFSRQFHTFAPVPQSAHRNGQVGHLLERTFVERFLRASDLANLTNPRRYGNMNVHEGCIISYRIRTHCDPPATRVSHIPYYNTSWRGLSVLLILGGWQCESQRPGISGKYGLPRLSCILSSPVCVYSAAKRVGGDVQCDKLEQLLYERKI